MKRITLSAALLLGASFVAFAAEPPDVPKHKCEPKPVLPGQAVRQDRMVSKRFKEDLDNYKACMQAYADARSAASKAHAEAANKAISEYNDTIKEINEAQNR